MGVPRAPEPSSEALDSANVLEVAPAVAPHVNGAGAAAVSKARPAATPIPFSQRSAIESDDFPAVKKSNKGVIFVVVGLGIAAGLGLFLKFALSNDDEAKTTPTAPTTTMAAKKENDIPPPPPKEETPPPPAVTTAAATPPPPATTAEAKPTPPTPTKEPVAKVEPPPRVAAAPAQPKTPKQPASQPAAAPKTTPKPPSGGIVRDSPF
jgi:hypothetical protein